MREGWWIEEASGITLVRCGALLDVPGIAHAFSTRRADGREDFDLGVAQERDAERLARRGRFLQAAGLGHPIPFVLRQVHGAGVVRAAGVAGLEDPPDADGAIWSREEPEAPVPSIRTADCVPILLVDRGGAAAAALHAGWRGTAAGIALRAVEELGRMGIPAADLRAALGPAILACCYEVGGEVAAAVAASHGDLGEKKSGPVSLDLHEANARQLVLAGLAPDAIHRAPWCTRCRGDLFFSHRRDGASTGRMMASIGRGGP